MKQNLNSFALLFFLLFLITTSQPLAHSLASKQGEEELKLNEITTEVSLVEKQETDSSNTLMGLVEDCQSGGEECLDRRMVAEAHLDYIYTQHHKP
ncbi:Phytosulfokine-beta like [Actinidia chinensis var. chinensis]|uniref:Phytosulfokine n=1 Tax=Actinidia chinensis var. chinensis TaxID=1590841 RepID=A0A2R6Q7D4_ACTCC|nr:Phytosulfokine-beta like [Actinidia chinensis var. chinensis]